MVVYIFTDGNVKIVSPENIYQGSTVSEITLLTPFPSTTSLSVGFVMPDGTKLTAQPMNYTQTIVDGQSVTAYTYTLPYTVTEQAGEVQMAFAALFSNGTQTSYMARFEVQESVLPEPPAQPDEDTYELILQYAQTAMQNAANAQSAAEAAQTAAESAEDKAAAAETTAGQANATANAANTTAGQANTKADQAVTTSNNAAATAAAANQTAIEAKSAASAAQSAAAQAQEDADAAAKSASAAETSAGEAADSAEEAVTTAQGAATTANEAKTTADGIDGKATQALSNSEQAVTTANEAKALAEQAVAGAGTEVYVDNALQSRLDFTSDPQTQINDKQTQIDNIESGVTKVGAAGQADKLATARNLKVNLASGAAQAFDGSDNAENIGVGGVLPVANGGTGASNLSNIKVGSAGSADQAAKLSTARNLQVNVASGNSQAFDGSGNATEIGVKGILPESNGGTGAASLDNIKVGSAGSADQATRATADGSGNNIANTYINGVLQATNLNSISQSDVGTIVRTCESASNQPVSGGGVVIQYYGGNGYYAQLFIANDEDCTTWRRNNRSGTWTSWQKVLSGASPQWVTGTGGSLTLTSSGWYIFEATTNSSRGWITSGIVYWNYNEESNYVVFSSLGTLGTFNLEITGSASVIKSHGTITLTEDNKDFSGVNTVRYCKLA